MRKKRRHFGTPLSLGVRHIILDVNCKLLVLDLDESLIHATEQPLETPHHFDCGPYMVYKRPHVTEFLSSISEHFELGVWTSSTADYATCITDNLFTGVADLSFIMSRNDCVRRFDPDTLGFNYLKDLKKLKRRGYALEHIVVVDDSPEKLSRNYGNLVRVNPFFGDAGDEELVLLEKYLIKLKDIENVRAVEKRNWRANA